jgi:hypothetical protein
MVINTSVYGHSFITRAAIELVDTLSATLRRSSRRRLIIVNT